MTRPTGNNADEWHLFLTEHCADRANTHHGLTFMAVQIAEALDDARAKAIGEAVAICIAEQKTFLSPRYAANQPASSFGERFACGCCAEKIEKMNAR